MKQCDSEINFPSPKQLLEEIPQSKEHLEFIFLSRKRVEAILNGYDSRLLLIIGPCSIHDPQAALEYAEKLQKLSHEVSDRFYIVMRCYFEKPRTIIGWKGMLYDPHLDGSYDIRTGLRKVRQLLVDLTDLEIPVGSEILEFNTTHYYEDYLTWGCIGARTCASPPHRQLASALSFPIGFKNSPDGNLDHPIHAILSAATPHTFLGQSKEGRTTTIQTKGNPQCHIVLRGSSQGPNYHAEAIQKAIEKCDLAKIRNKILIDCSHDNCFKNHNLQSRALSSVLDQIESGNTHIVGAMLESFLHAGSQPLSSDLKYGVSITDSCLDWDMTERIIREAYERMDKTSHFISNEVYVETL